MPEPRVPLAAPDLAGNEEAYVLQALRSTWISSTGEFLRRFESTFAEICETRHALAVTNGTVALHLALLGLGAGPGDEVIVPSLTYVATANAVRYVGADPVFVDVEPQTWCLSPEAVEAAVTPRTRGVIAVHLYGHPADMNPINKIAAAYGLWVVEDAAEAPLARYHDRPIGSLGTVATFSFYGNKVLTSGEGGALTVDDDALAARMRMLRGQGMDPQRRYFFPVTGYNFRLTNLAAALLCAQLERAPALVERRAQICRRYRNALRSVPHLELQPHATWATPTPWLFSVLVGDTSPVDRDALAASLEHEGIETRPFFVPMHHLPPFRSEAESRRLWLPVTDTLARRGLNLPTFSTMTDAQVDRVVDRVRAALDGTDG